MSPLESGDWTWGELVSRIHGVREGERRWFRQQALVAWGEMVLRGRQLAGEHLPELYEVFPFWNTEEVNEMRVARYRGMLERMAGGDRDG